LILAANQLALRPEAPLQASRHVVREEMRKLGAMSRAELLTAVIVGASVLAWASQPWHRVPAEAIGMLALTLLFAAGVLTAAEIGTGIPWGLALFVGGMLSLSTVITTFKINQWIGSFIVPAIEPFAGHPLVFVTAMTIGVVLLRFIDPVGFITIAAFFLSLSGFVVARGLDPLVLVGAILFPLHVFWFTYQNIWIVMTDGVTARRAYTDRDRFRLATVYLAVTLVALWIAVGYWMAIGVA
jgi:hypothetical protein